MIIGITGGIGSGQSTVAQMFAKLGAEIVSADKLAREIMEPGQLGYQAVVKVFGKEYLTVDKRIDRKKLGDLAFGNIRQLRLLNKTIHPILFQRIKQEIKKLDKHSKNKTKNPLLILDAAILFETKMHCLVDGVIVVYASKSTRINRIKKRDKLTLREIDLRINSQMPLKKKAQLADYLINNSKSLKETNKQVEHIWKYIYQNIKARKKVN